MAMKEKIEEKLNAALKPERLEISNDSHLHKGHAGDDGSGESHFSIIIVSEAFKGKSRVQRHRIIHQILKVEMTEIHALSICAMAPDN